LFRLGLAYAGSHREDLMATLLPHVADDALSMEVVSLTALALGFIFVGSANGEIAGTILQTIMERMEPDDTALGEKWARFLILGLALLYLGESENRVHPRDRDVDSARYHRPTRYL
jgi:26S proteasome regulatory subunit N1